MKKIFIVLLFVMTAKISAQNLQLHYDMGEDRKYFTTTLEMFKPDEYGSTFFFVDFDYDFSGNNGISLAYFEIARYITIYEKLRAGTTGTNDKEIVFLTEPQIWYNIDNHVSVGTEFEISNNFLPFQKEIKVMPTLGIKWNF